MEERKAESFSGERALFGAHDLALTDCIFENGESPLKHSRNVSLSGAMFKWKYPLWYSKDVAVRDSTFFEMGRAGIWYTENVTVEDTAYLAPKGFRRCDGVVLKNVDFANAAETLWQCRNVRIDHVFAKGDYFAMNSENIEVSSLTLDGNYSFDGCRNVTVRSSRLLSKDAFWNCEDVLVENCYISGEYLGWNSKRVRFVNCTIESLQGLCFIEDLVMENCTLLETTLAFEYSTVTAEITGHIDSVKNPSGGVISAASIGEIILEADKVDPAATKILCRGKEKAI